MPKSITHIFTEHPDSVGETWFEHLCVAASFAGWLSLAAGAALVHALVPAACETTASDIIRKLHTRMEARH